ncbi:MAG: DUF309 domain-containing protein [Pseudanabaenaceae cyanobacterium SKYGB_i_bin29]|nr:DUF309 domain-containing protein [Pseudanabaenaceae cyanobacterium SKYG29]MDW8420681.1 DUF309 domain-containing protein [Pseudanabaenaceae cyanobacterium SKYGB_i_bin29]
MTSSEDGQTGAADLEVAVGLFNQQDFYLCHDILEEIWHNAPPEERNFYQGLLQVAVGCYHLQQGNTNGAKILLGEGIYRLHQYEDGYHGLDLGHFLEGAENLLLALQADAPLPPYPNLGYYEER